MHRRREAYNFATIRRWGLEVARGMEYLVGKDLAPHRLPAGRGERLTNNFLFGAV
jgi:hypothetical protein